MGEGGAGGAEAKRWFPQLLTSYRDVLRALLKLLPVRAGADASAAAAEPEPATVPGLEAAVAKKFKQLGCPSARLDAFLGADFVWPVVNMSRGSALAVLRRAQALYLVHNIKELLLHTCFVGLLGPENSGKSSLVKGMAENLGNDFKVPDIGVRRHTSRMGGYQLRDRLWVVDFPGCNSMSKEAAAAWQRFASVPSFCVLIVPFTGDVNTDVLRLYKEIKGQHPDTEIVVVLNKVDAVLREDPLGAKDFAACREDFCCALGCSPGDVLFSTLRPSVYTEDMAALGVLDTAGVCRQIRRRAEVITVQ